MHKHMEFLAQQGHATQTDEPQLTEWQGIQGYAHPDGVFHVDPKNKKAYNKNNGYAFDWDIVSQLPSFQKQSALLHAVNTFSDDKLEHLDAHDIPDVIADLAAEAIGASAAPGSVPFADTVWPFLQKHMPSPGSVIPIGVVGGVEVFGVVTPETVDFYDKDGNDVSLMGADGPLAYLDLTKTPSNATVPEDLINFKVDILDGGSSLATTPAVSVPEAAPELPPVVEEETPTEIPAKPTTEIPEEVMSAMSEPPVPIQDTAGVTIPEEADPAPSATPEVAESYLPPDVSEPSPPEGVSEESMEPVEAEAMDSVFDMTEFNSFDNGALFSVKDDAYFPYTKLVKVDHSKVQPVTEEGHVLPYTISAWSLSLSNLYHIGHDASLVSPSIDTGLAKDVTKDAPEPLVQALVKLSTSTANLPYPAGTVLKLKGGNYLLFSTTDVYKVSSLDDDFEIVTDPYTYKKTLKQGGVTLKPLDSTGLMLSLGTQHIPVPDTAHAATALYEDLPHTTLSALYDILDYHQAGEHYPEHAPPPKTQVQFENPFGSLTKDTTTINFGTQGLAIFGSEESVPESLKPWATYLYGDKHFVPYNAHTKPVIEAYLSHLQKTPSVQEQELLKDAKPLAVGDTVPLKSSAASGLTAHQISKLPLGTEITISSAPPKLEGDWVKVGENEWKKVYASGNKGVSTMFHELLSAADSAWQTPSVKIAGQPDAATLQKLQTKAAKKAKKLAAAAKEAGYQGSPAHAVHVDELIAQGAPKNLISKLKALQENGTKASGTPKEIPPIGTVLKIDSAAHPNSYLVFGETGVYAFQNTNGEFKQLYVPGASGDYLDIYKKVSAYLHGQGSITLKSAHAKNKLAGYDFENTSHSEMMANVPKDVPNFEECPYGGGAACKTHGGDGAHHHHSGYIHPLTAVSDVSTLPDNVQKIANAVDKDSKPPAWAMAPGAVKVYTSANGDQEYLIGKEDGYTHVHTDGGISHISHSAIESHEGAHPYLDSEKWNLNYWSPKGTLYTPDAIPATLPTQLKSHNYYDSLGEPPSNEVSALFADPTNVPLTGSILHLHSKDGKEYYLKVHKNHIQVYNESGHKVPFSSPALTEEFGLLAPPEATLSPEYAALKQQLDEKPKLLGSGVQVTNVPFAVSNYAQQGSYGTHDDTPPWFPVPGSVYAAADVDGEPYYLVVGPNTLVKFNKYGSSLETTPFYSTVSAVDLANKYYLFPNHVPESIADGFQIYASTQFPSDAPSAVIAMAAKEYDTVDVPEGFPPVGKLHVTTDDNNSLKYVLNTGINTLIYDAQGSQTDAIYNEDVEPQEALILKNLGFNITAPIAASAKVVVQPHPLPKLPNVGDLKATGESIGGGQHPNQIFEDADGTKYLWKPLPHNYHNFVVHAESCASAIAAQILGDGAVYAEHQTLAGKSGTLQKVLPANTVLVGKDKDPAQLMKDHGEKAILQMLAHHPADWLIANHDTHGNQFLVTPSGVVVGIDKGQAFKHFPNDTLSLDYFPNGDTGSDGPYSYRTWAKLKELDFDKEKAFAAVGKSIARIQGISDKEYRKSLTPYLDARFSNQADKDTFFNKFIARKNSMRSDFEAFLHSVYGHPVDLQPYVNASAVSVPHAKVLTMPSATQLGVEGEYEEVHTPAVYEDVTSNTLFKDIASQKYGIKVKPHFKDHLVAAFAKDAATMQQFLDDSKLEPVGNKYDKDGNQLGGIKPTPYGVMVALHKDAYETAHTSVTESVLKTPASVEYKLVGEKPAFKHPDAVSFPHTSGKPMQILPYQTLDGDFAPHNTFIATDAVVDKLLPQNGHFAMLGSPHVYGSGGMVIHKIKDTSGVEHYEAKFKLTPDMYKQIANLSSMPVSTTKKRKYDKDAGIVQELHEAGHSVNDLAHDVHILKAGKYEIHISSSNAPYSSEHQVSVRVPASSVKTQPLLQGLRKALTAVKTKAGADIPHLGELIQAPTEESLKLQTYRQLAFSRIPYSAYLKMSKKSPDVELKELTKALTDHGVDLDKVKLVQAGNGHVTAVESGSYKKYFTNQTGMKHITHGSRINYLIDAIKRGSLVSHHARVAGGYDSPGGGMVSNDVEGGGSLSVFGRANYLANTYNSDNSGGFNVSVILAPQLMDRGDVKYASDDTYGWAKPTGGYASSMKKQSVLQALESGDMGSSNEIFWRHGVSATAFLGVHVSDESYRQQVLEKFQDAGITQVNGIPIADFVVTSHNAATELTKKALEAS